MSSFTLTCIYASTSGNVEKVVETAVQVWRDLGWSVELHRAEKTSIDIFQKNDHFLLATSTWEHGALNPFFGKLYKEMATADFQGRQAAFIGLGDSRYEPVLFCEGMEIVKRRWVEQHGEVVGIPLKINGEPYAQLDPKVVPWAQQLAKQWAGDGGSPVTKQEQPSGIQKIINSVFNNA